MRALVDFYRQGRQPLIDGYANLSIAVEFKDALPAEDRDISWFRIPEAKVRLVLACTLTCVQ